MANFDELLPKVNNWDVEEEEMLINKIKTMTEDYQQKCSDLSINLNNINRNLHLIHVDFFNSLNGLKTLSGNKFIEHVVDPDEKKPEEEQKVEEIPEMDENIKDEHFNSINSILQRSFDFIALRDQQKSQNKNNQEDDTISMNSKLMDNNLTKNNRGLKLPLIIGTNDFLLNDYIGLVNDEDEEEEDFNNEIKNDLSIPVPPEGGPGEVILNNNPEDFHNMIQQNMGKPVQRQSMFDEETKEGEKELVNPALAMQVDEQEDTGLGGLLRSSSIKKPNLNNPMGMNNIEMNLNRAGTTNFSNMRLSAAGGKGQIKLANFLGNNFLDDDEDDDGSGLFSRPQGSRGGLGMSMALPGMNNLGLNNNQMMNPQMMNSQMMNTQMMNNQMMVNQNMLNPQSNNINPQMSNIVMPGIETQNNNIMGNPNININQQNEQLQKPEENEKLPLNQRMVMVPNPLLLAMKQQNIQPQIQQNQIQPELQPQQQQNLINNQNTEEQKNNEMLNNNSEANTFQDKRKNLEKLFSHPQSIPQMKNEAQTQNILNNQMNPMGGMNLNMDLNSNMDMNANMNMNTAVNPLQPTLNMGMNSFLSKKEIENNQKLEKAKTKLNSIFGDDDEDEDDLFSRKGQNQTQKIEEKSQNLQERLNQLTSTFATPSNNLNKNAVNDLFSMDQNTNPNTNVVPNNNILNNNLNTNATNTNTSAMPKKKKAFFDDDEDEDFTAALKPKPQPTTQINNNINPTIQTNQNIQVTQNPVKNEPRIIMPKPMGVNLFQTQTQKPEKKKISLFDDMESNEPVPTKIVNNAQTNTVKAPSSLFDGININQKPEINPQQNPIPNINNTIQIENQKKPKIPSFFLEDEEKVTNTNEVKPVIESKPVIQQPQFQPQGQNPQIQPQAQAQPQIQNPQIQNPLTQPQIQPQVQNPQIQHPLNQQPQIQPTVQKPQMQHPLMQTQPTVQNQQIQHPLMQPQIQPTPVQKPQIQHPLMQPQIQPQAQKPQIQHPLMQPPQVQNPQIQQPTIQPQDQPQNSQNQPQQTPSLDTQKPAKKKASLFDFLDAKPSTTSSSNNANTNTNTNINKEQPKEENIPRISKPEEPKPRLTVFEDSASKKKGNKMASRFEQMVEEQKKDERKSVHVTKAQPKKLDFASKISNLQNVLGGRMAMGGNVFTMPTGGIKSLTNVGADIVHDEAGNENVEGENKTEIKDISAENTNVIIEENKIQETSYEKQLEKKKESTVVVKKKKPKRINFQDAGNENKTEEVNTEQKINNMFNFENNNTQEQPAIEQKSKENTKIDLFAEIKPKETKPVLNELFKEDNKQSKPPVTSSNLNNIFEMDINKPKTPSLNQNNIFSDNNTTNQVNANISIKENNNLNKNNIFNMEQTKPAQNINVNNNLINNQQKEVQSNLEINNLSNNISNTNQPALNINMNNNIPSQNQNILLNNEIPNIALNSNLGNNSNQNNNDLLNNNQNQPTLPENKPKIDLFSDIKPQTNKPKIDLFADIKPQEKPKSVNNIFENNNNQNITQPPQQNITQQKQIQQNINLNNNLTTDQPKENQIPSNINNNMFMAPTINNEMNTGNNINLNNQFNTMQQNINLNQNQNQINVIQSNTNQLNPLLQNINPNITITPNINVNVNQQPLLTANVNMNLNNNQNNISIPTENNNFLNNNPPNIPNNNQQLGQNIVLNNNINQNQPSVTTNNIFSQQNPQQNNFQQNLFNQNTQIQNQQQNQNQNIFMQNNNNINQNIFMQNNTNLNQNNQQAFSGSMTQPISVESSQPKKFKSMFEDDDDQINKKIEVNIKNPIADKRLSFLFDDD